MVTCPWTSSWCMEGRIVRDWSRNQTSGKTGDRKLESEVRIRQRSKADIQSYADNIRAWMLWLISAQQAQVGRRISENVTLTSTRRCTWDAYRDFWATSNSRRRNWGRSVSRRDSESSARWRPAHEGGHRYLRNNHYDKEAKEIIRGQTNPASRHTRATRKCCFCFRCTQIKERAGSVEKTNPA